MNMYAIVKFVEENDAPGIVCSHWLNKDNDTCLYPNVKTNEARDRLLKRGVNPSPNWPSCPVKVLQKYNTFKAALQQLSRAEETSNLESEEEPFLTKRKHKRTRLLYPGEESDEESVSLLQPKKVRRGDPVPYPAPPSERFEREECVFPDRGCPPIPPVETTPPLQFSQSTYSSQIDDLTFSSLHTPSASFSNQNVMNGRLDAWMADVSSNIQRLEGKMDTILNILAHRNQSQDNPVEDFSALGSLPVTNDSSFEELNRKLFDRNFRYLLIKVFVSLGGKDLRNHIQNMLRKVMLDEVAELYSLSGKSTIKNSAKKPFLVTQIYSSIFSACRQVYKEQATEMRIKEAIADWLHQAKVRRIRRIQRLD